MPRLYCNICGTGFTRLESAKEHEEDCEQSVLSITYTIEEN